VLLRLIDAFVLSDALALAWQLLLTVLLGYAIYVILLHIFGTRRVTFNTVCASLCIYVFLALIWAMAYSAIAQLDPGAFTYTVAGKELPPFRVDRGDTAALYFSFSTLTTLGYGDIVPTSPISRLLTSVEAVTGQLYLAVLVARLVGLHIAGSMEQRMNKGTWESRENA
jgi:hypothetical protein